MNFFAVARRKTAKLFDMPADHFPDSRAVDITGVEQFIGALRGSDLCVDIMKFDHQPRSSPNVDLVGHNLSFACYRKLAYRRCRAIKVQPAELAQFSRLNLHPVFT